MTSTPKHILLPSLLALLLATISASAVNIVSVPGFEDYPGSISDPVLEPAGYHLTSGTVTVDALESNFTDFIGNWGTFSAGNGISAPIGTGNDSNRATGNRKAGRYIQILPLDAVLNGATLQIDWRYGVADTYTSDVSFQVDVFAFNEATGGEAATTFNANLTFGGETFNSALLDSQVISLTYNAGDTANDDIDGIWHDAPTRFVNITQSWDYIGIAIKRNTGIGNSTAAQTDDVSIQIVPEPQTYALLFGAMVLVSALVRRRRA